MTKGLLRFCVYVYRGILLVANACKKIFRLFTPKKENIAELSKKTSMVIKKEKQKQKALEKREALRIKEENSKLDKASLRKKKREEKFANWLLDIANISRRL